MDKLPSKSTSRIQPKPAASTDKPGQGRDIVECGKAIRREKKGQGEHDTAAQGKRKGGDSMPAMGAPSFTRAANRGSRCQLPAPGHSQPPATERSRTEGKRTEGVESTMRGTIRRMFTARCEYAEQAARPEAGSSQRKTAVEVQLQLSNAVEAATQARCSYPHALTKEDPMQTIHYVRNALRATDSAIDSALDNAIELLKSAGKEASAPEGDTEAGGAREALILNIKNLRRIRTIWNCRKELTELPRRIVSQAYSPKTSAADTPPAAGRALGQNKTAPQIPPLQLQSLKNE